MLVSRKIFQARKINLAAGNTTANIYRKLIASVWQLIGLQKMVIGRSVYRTHRLFFVFGIVAGSKHLGVYVACNTFGSYAH